MILTVRDSPLRPPLLVTKEATWLDIRDDQGYLIYVLIFPPGGATFLVTDKNDPDFESTVKGFNIPMKIDPSV